MSKDKLIISEYSREFSWRIAWLCEVGEDDFEEGATLGDDVYKDEDLAKAKREDWSHVAATLAASKTESVQRDERGYFWETSKEAKAALRVVQEALKNKGKPWPEWALKAKAAGWKPPKSWKP